MENIKFKFLVMQIIAILIIVSAVGCEVIQVSSNDDTTKTMQLATTEDTLPAETIQTTTKVATTEDTVAQTTIVATTSVASTITTTEETTIATINTTSTESSASISLISLTSPIAVNKTATIAITGKPNTEYQIQVIYSKGASKAKGLENKTSDENGQVSWSWKVGVNTTPGTYTIKITGGGETFSTKFTVE